MADARVTKYVIGKKKFAKQQVGYVLSIHKADGEGYANEEMHWPWYEVLFGVDDKGVRYMALATEEQGATSHGAGKSGGHWHGAGLSFYTMGYNVKLRKNFKDADEANRYYNIVRNMTEWKVTEEKRFTEAQIDKLFA